MLKQQKKLHENSDNKDAILKVRTEIIASTIIADAIVNYTKEKHIDLIITGTRSRSKLKSVLPGSIASDVVIRAHCPVLIAR